MSNALFTPYDTVVLQKHMSYFGMTMTREHIETSTGRILADCCQCLFSTSRKVQVCHTTVMRSTSITTRYMYKSTGLQYQVLGVRSKCLTPAIKQVDEKLFHVPHLNTNT